MLLTNLDMALHIAALQNDPDEINDLIYHAVEVGYELAVEARW